jgi:RNAse (barnase) inhibitor barstar
MDRDRAILQNGPIALYYRPATLADDVAWFRAHDYAVDELDAGAWSDVAAMHRDFAATLAFPDYFGKNLDALNDCIGDLEGARRAIVLRRFDAFAKVHPDVAQAVLDILAVNSRRFLLDGTRLVILVQSDDPRIAFDPVGACPVGWNPKEWLNANRGL